MISVSISVLATAVALVVLVMAFRQIQSSNAADKELMSAVIRSSEAYKLLDSALSDAVRSLTDEQKVAPARAVREAAPEKPIGAAHTLVLTRDRIEKMLAAFQVARDAAPAPVRSEAADEWRSIIESSGTLTRRRLEAAAVSTAPSLASRRKSQLKGREVAYVKSRSGYLSDDCAAAL